MILPALSYPQYRLLWFSGLSSWIGRWMETVVGAWLVLELTDSPFLVGLLGACRFASMAFGPFCGTVCDRIGQRSILLAVQVAYGLASLVLLALFAFGRIEAWHLFAFTLLSGLFYTFDYSARYSAAACVVEDSHIVSSMSLLQVASGFTSVVGPLIGGSLLDAIGAVGSFLLIAVCFLLSWCLLLPLKIGPQAVARRRGSIWKDLISGLHYIRDDRLLLSLILLAALVNLVVFPYTYVIIPIFARDILVTGPGGFGLLVAAAGLGAVLGSLGIGFLTSRFANHGRLLVGAIIAWPAILLLFAFSESLAFSIALLVLAGIGQGVALALLQALLLMGSTEEMRGRVSGTRAFAISTLALGNVVTGYEAALWGAPVAMVVNGSISILITVLIAVWVPQLAGSGAGRKQSKVKAI